jgi:hypothetical protein
MLKTKGVNKLFGQFVEVGKDPKNGCPLGRPAPVVLAVRVGRPEDFIEMVEEEELLGEAVKDFVPVA